MREVSVEGLDVIGRGGMGTIYRLNDEQIIKVYNPDVSLDEIKEKKKYAREVFVRGVPTMISFDIVTVADSYGIIFELLPSDTVAKAVNRDASALESYGRRMGTILKEMHSIEIPGDVMPRMKDRMMGWIDSMEHEYHAPRRIVRSMRQLAEILPDTDNVLHCDFHEGNIMLRGPEALILIDVDEVCVGSPIYDLAFCYGNHDLLSKSAKYYKSSVGMDPSMAGNMRHYMMSEYFGTEDRKFLKKIDRILLPVCLMTFCVAPARVGDSHYMDKRNEWITKNIVYPVFHIVWLLNRRWIAKQIDSIDGRD